MVGERVCYDVANRVKKGASWIVSPLDAVLSLNTNQINDRVAGIEKAKLRAKIFAWCWLDVGGCDNCHGGEELDRGTDKRDGWERETNFAAWL